MASCSISNGDQTEVLPLLRLEPIVSSLTVSLVALDDLVARRLDTNERIKTLLRGVFQTNDETRRLLAPWLMVMDSQISGLVDGVRKANENDGGDAARRLAALVELQRPAQIAQRQVSAAVDMLAEASTTDQDRRLPVLAFQLGGVLRDLEVTAAGLDPKLRPLFLEQVAKLREFVAGPNAIAEARKQELALVGEGERRLAENASLSGQLTAAVDQLASAAKRDIGDATRDALSVQRLSTRVLVALVALSLLTSVLIVWLYVGRNIVRRLTALSDGMLAIAGGRLHAAVAAQGADEIAAMGRAVEIFRRNAIELERLLEERKEAAARLEHLVDERTRELERRSSVLRVTFDNMGHGVVMFDRDQRMVAWNQRFQELLELPDDRVGHEVTFAAYHSASCRTRRVRPLRCRGTGCPAPLVFSTALQPTNGRGPTARSWRFAATRCRAAASFRSTPTSPSSGERKRSVELARARLTDAIESISDGFALWDKDDRLVIFNSRCEELLNAADLFVVGTRFEDLVHAFSVGGRYDPSQGEAAAWVEERLALHRDAPSTCETAPRQRTMASRQRIPDPGRWNGDDLGRHHRSEAARTRTGGGPRHRRRSHAGLWRRRIAS